ncbi:hypothetical protein VNO77_21459 [Canavalia gladiata]|uniref:Uncharacterized protein n=1 Tax=Canavalia gladiata TaxID=3824 RepID=A0AAN9LVR3_CANGL
MIMKLQNILLVTFALFALFSHGYGRIQYCFRSVTLPGLCPNGYSRKSCLEEFTRRFPSGMPRDCTCANHVYTRKCTCKIVCQ